MTIVFFTGTVNSALLCRMSQRKMLHFLAGALLLLLSLFDDLVLGEISNDFHQCLEFFYNNKKPSGITGNQYRPICQRYENSYRFATLYNRNHRAPVYSAYTINLPLEDSRARNEWKYEPQVRCSLAKLEELVLK